MSKKNITVDVNPLETTYCKLDACCDYECAVQDGSVYPYEEQCPPPKPWRPKDCDLTTQGVYDKYKDAVVRISTQTAVTSSVLPTPLQDPIPSFTGEINQESENTIDQYYTFGNGFFIDKHYIVAPAHLVLLPPDFLGYYRRYNYPNMDPILAPVPVLPDGTPGSAILDGNRYASVGRILVDVFNVNGSNINITYEARLVGIDGAADLAILQIICSGSLFNSFALALRVCHPKFKFGNSAKYRNGEKVVVMGDLFMRNRYISNYSNDDAMMVPNVRGFSCTTVYNYRYTDPSGLIQPELVILNSSSFISSSGSPIVNKYGRVIGMQTLNVTLNNQSNQIRYTDGLIGGPSQRSFINSIVKILTVANGRSYAITQTCPGPVVSSSFDYGDILFRNYFVVEHPYLGIAWELFTGIDFASTVDPISGVRVANYLSPLISGGYNYGPRYKNIAGLKVRAFSGNDDLATFPLVKNVFVPGDTTSGTVGFVNSPLLAKLQTVPLGKLNNSNDVLYAINKMLIGTEESQGHLTNPLWSCLTSGSSVELVFRLWENSLNVTPLSQSEPYSEIYSTTVKLAKMPAGVNYPWYKYNSLPLSSLFLNTAEDFYPLLPKYETTSPAASESYFFPSV